MYLCTVLSPSASIIRPLSCFPRMFATLSVVCANLNTSPTETQTSQTHVLRIYTKKSPQKGIENSLLSGSCRQMVMSHGKNQFFCSRSEIQKSIFYNVEGYVSENLCFQMAYDSSVYLHRNLCI